MAIGKDKTVILSTHVMQEVEAMCDRVIFIKAGKIQRDDSVENITKSSSMEEAFRLATADWVTLHSSLVDYAKFDIFSSKKALLAPFLFDYGRF